MKTTAWIDLACATGLIACSQHASAETTTTTSEEVVVTGVRLEETLPEQLARYGTQVDVIPDKQIQNGGYIDIATALQGLAPGLYVSSKNGPFDYVDISLQGSRTQDVLWMIDGVRINNRLYGGTTPLDTLPSSMVERIEVLNGGQALFYGTQAVAGAVNIVTMDFTTAADGGFSVGGDTQHGTHADGYFRDAIGGHQFVIYGSSDKSSGYQPFRDSDYQPSSTDRNRDYKVLTGGLKYAYELSDALRLSVLFQHTDGQLDYAMPSYSALTFNERDEDLLSLKLDYTINDNAQLFVKGYGHRWRSHFTEFDHVLDSDGNVVPGELDVVDDHDFWGYKDYGLNAMSKLKLHRGVEYLFGYDYQNYSGNDAVLRITQQTEHVHAVFAQARTTDDFSSKARFAAGLRYNDPNVGKAATVWNVGGEYEFSKAWLIRGSAGTAFRLPTAEELFADDPNDERGNPNLKPERTRYLTIGLGGQAQHNDLQVQWDLAGFFRKIDQLITFDDFDDTTNQSVATNSPASVKVRGVELHVHVAPNSTVSADASFTVNHSRRSDNDLQITRVPVQQYKLVLDYHPMSLPFGASLAANHVGAVHSSVWDGRERYGDYTIVDVAGRVFLDEKRRHTISLRLENVFDKEYASSIGSASRDADGSSYTYWNLGMPRTLSARYTYRFNGY